ncbi:MAG: hypothetical protein QXJ02_00155 [Candidatus Bathyarchaeia archaeon]
MTATSKVERQELYKGRDTQTLISKFLNGEIKELNPVFDPKLGYRYPEVEAIVGDSQMADDFLNKLYSAGILRRKLYDKVIYCPQCNTANVSVRYCCPYCKSFDIRKSSLIEHVKCGYMDVEENFAAGAKLSCPKCHDELRKLDVDYRKAGVWCTCNDCKRSFDIPVSSHFCRDCKENFSFEEIRIENVYSYTLSEEARGEAKIGWIVIAPIKEFFEEQGFEVESPAYLKGKSGANHLFDIVASKGEVTRKITVVDVTASSEPVVSEQPVIALFAKIFDVSPHKAYLIVIPQLSENGKKMAELYHIQVIEAKNEKEAVRSLKESMTS